jgi:SAM-dependent methyltransferase
MNTPFQASQFWNDRYGQPAFAYGTEPNEFFAQQLARLTPGRLLLPAEGEGRNAVFAAQLGWAVDAFDFSEAAQQKAMQLASDREVSIRYTLADLLTFQADYQYDTLGLIFVHLAPEPRRQMLTHLTALLKPGGILLLEGFHPAQIGLPSGGPNTAAFCYTTDELTEILAPNFTIQQLTDRAITLAEGAYHHGPAHTVRLVAVKR